VASDETKYRANIGLTTSKASILVNQCISCVTNDSEDISLSMYSAPKKLKIDPIIPPQNNSKKDRFISFCTFSLSSLLNASVSTGRSELRKTVPYIIPTSTIFIGRA
jgi:hypothetical protein